MKDRINKLFLLTSASSLLIVLGVFLPFIQMKVSIFLMGISNSQTATFDYWRHGEADGKYLLVVAVVSLVLAFLKKYKWLWISAVLSIGVIAYSIINSLLNASSVAKSPYAEMAKTMMQNTKISIIPREGLFLLIAGFVILIVAAVFGVVKGGSHDNKYN